jgi:hypothetical protein
LIGLKNDWIPENPAASLSSSVRQPFFSGAMVACLVLCQNCRDTVHSRERRVRYEMHCRVLRRLQY